MNEYSFIIPCYNCDTFIRKNIKKLENELKKLKIKRYELILIDDGSLDKTYEKIKDLSFKNKLVKIIRNKKNIGKSYSSIRGIRESNFQKIILIDCDLPYFDSLKHIIFNLDRNNDLVIVNRKLKESKLVTTNINLYQLLRYFIGNLIAFINIKILKIEIPGGDTQAGLKGFKKIKNFDKLKFVSRKFFFDLELILIYSRKKLKILSVKTNYSISSNSSIKIFSIYKNIEILSELFRVIKKYNKL